MENNTYEFLDPSMDAKRVWLCNLISEKMQKNPQFSLRAFAKKVNIGPSLLSRILNGKRNLSFKMAVKISDSLQFSLEEREELFSFFTFKQCNATTKINKN